jgi:hypothetical protein
MTRVLVGRRTATGCKQQQIPFGDDNQKSRATATATANANANATADCNDWIDRIWKWFGDEHV